MKALIISIFFSIFCSEFVSAQVTKLNVKLERKAIENIIELDKNSKSFFEFKPHCSLDHGIFLKPNLPDGEYHVFYNNILAYKGFYENNKREGHWLHYNKDGSVSYSELYKNGELIEE